MFKTPMLLLALLICGSSIRAQDVSTLPDNPVPKVQKEPRTADKKFWLKVAVMGASAGFHTYGGNVCRRNNGVEPCTAHYGEYRGTEIADYGLTTVFAALYYKCRKDNENSKWCDILPTLIIGGNTYWGRHEMRIHHKEKD